VNSHKLHPAYDEVLKDLAVIIMGKRDTGFFADTGGFHRGVVPT
jgi:hypothetical protein